MTLFRIGIAVFIILLVTNCNHSKREVEKPAPITVSDSFWDESANHLLKIGWKMYSNYETVIIADYQSQRDTITYPEFSWNELPETYIEEINGVKQRIIEVNDTLYAFDTPYLEGTGRYLLGVQIKNGRPMLQDSNWIFSQFPYIWDKKRKTITIHVERMDFHTQIWDIHHFPAKRIDHYKQK